MTKLALIYHHDTGGSPEQMIRVIAAYEAARCSLEEQLIVQDPGPDV